MRRLAVACLLLVAVSARAQEVGNLVIDGVPEIPKATSERLLQYQNTRSATFLDWDAGGKGMLIATRFGETTQIHLVSGPGMARQELTFFPEPVTEAAADPARPGGFYFRMDVGGGEFFQYFWYDAQTGRHTLITDGGKGRNQSLSVANAGGKIAFTSTLRDKKNFDLYVAKTGDAKPRLVKELEGDWEVGDWSPDDKRVLVLREVSADQSELEMVDVETGESQKLIQHPAETKISLGGPRFGPGGKGVFLTSDEDSEWKRLVYLDLASGKKTVLTPDLSWDVAQLAVSTDRKSLAYVTNENGRSVLHVASTAQPNLATKVPLAPGVISGLGFDRAGRRLGFTFNRGAAPADAFVYDLVAHKVTQWTASEVGGLPPDRFVEPSLIQFPSFDARPIPAWVYRPQGKTKGKTPVIIVIHGGPESQELPSFNSTYQHWVNELGATVIAPNVRGSSGYGKSYLLLDNGFKREDSIKDIGALLDWIGKQPDLDAKRVGVIGGSYGGFMVLASLYSFPERIRCGVDYVGVSNMITFLQNTEDYRRDERRTEYGDEREPKMKEFLERIAPTTNAARIKSPLYVIQGANDPRVKASEADQMVKAVRGNGSKVWYLLAKDEGHGFQKKKNQEYFRNSVSLFFETYLFGQP